MRVAVFGSGAVGGYFGARLAEAGIDVSFIARGKHFEAMRQQGLRVESLSGDVALNPVRVSDDPTEIGEVDVVLLGVKAWQVPEAAAALQPMIGADTFVVPLQNGIDAPSQLSATLGPAQVLGGLCGLIAYQVAPGHIRHAGYDPFVTFGELDNQKSERVLRLQACFNRATGVVANVSDDIDAAMWNKFIIIAAWSGLGAITRSPVGIFRTVPETRLMLKDSLQEIYDVGCARAVNLAPDCVESCMKIFDDLLPSGTASMQRDVIEGRPSELEQQTGAVVRLGSEAGVATPVNSFIYRSLLPLERRARGEIVFPTE